MKYNNIFFYTNNYKDLSNKQILSQSSYGPQIAVSYGELTGKSFPGMYGPNLAPYPRGSGLQTGGINYTKKSFYKKYKKYKNKTKIIRRLIIGINN